ncbi:MAG: hypothetical protein IKA20_00905 [Clostridia bacterium]|nr:hypothetical protein [Clostridia bacterium]
MKKTLMLLLSIMMACGTAAFAVACNDGKGGSSENLCAAHIDEDEDLICDVCGEEIEPEEAVEVTVTFTVKDLEENTLAGITVMFMSEDIDTISAVSGEGGKLTATLPTGSYSVMYDYDVETVGGYYQSNTQSVEIKENTTTIDLYLENRTPNGTQDRPFSLNVGENEVKIPANTSYYYIVYRAVNLYAEIQGESVKAIYDQTEYTPDENGEISIKLKGTNTNSVETILIENTANEEATYVVNITSAPGTASNPHEIKTLGEAITTDALPPRESVFYTYTATAAGTFTIVVSSENSYVSITNTRNSLNANTNDVENGTLTLTVEAGDQILIDCSVTVQGEETASVIFTPSLA